MGADKAVAYSYDKMNRQTDIRCNDNSTIIIYAYDSAGRLSSVTDNGRTISYAYDAASNRTEVHRPEVDGFWVRYYYDALTRVTAITEAGADPLVSYIATYSYDFLSRPPSVVMCPGRPCGSLRAGD